MGLFSKGLDFSRASSRANSELSFNPAEAVAAVILAAISADGHVSDEECRTGFTAISQMQLLKSYPADILGRIFSNLAGVFARHGIKDILMAAKQSIPHELNPTVFAIATDLVLADGVVTSEEEAILEDLCSLLEVPAEQAQQIINVLVIKNRG